MDISKLFPKVSYDLLARIVPGGALLLMSPFALGHSLGDASSALVGVGATSTVVFLSISVFVAYLLGTAISSVASILETLLLIAGVRRNAIFLVSKSNTSTGERRDTYTKRAKSILDTQYLSDDKEHPVYSGINTRDQAKRRLIDLYAKTLDALPAEGDKAAVRDLRARYRMLDSVTVATFLAAALSLGANAIRLGSLADFSWHRDLLTDDVGYLAMMIVLAVVFYLSAGGSWRIFQREIIRRHMASDASASKTADPKVNVAPASAAIPRASSLPARIYRQETAFVVGSETDFRLLSTIGRVAAEGSMNTPFGPSHWTEFEYGDNHFIFVWRYGKGNVRRWNPHANTWFAAASGANTLIAVSAAGAITAGIVPNDLVIPVDFIDFAGSKSFSELLEVEVFARMSPPFCPRWSAALSERLRVEHGQGRTVKCACTRGPRIETVMEVDFLRSIGADVVGMRQATEAILAREMGLCLASVTLILNMAESVNTTGGVARLEALKSDLDRELINRRMKTIYDALTMTSPPTGTCTCATAPRGLISRSIIKKSLTELTYPPQGVS